MLSRNATSDCRFAGAAPATYPNDIDFENRQIRLRAINAKWNKGRAIPMTQRVYEELLKLK